MALLAASWTAYHHGHVGCAAVASVPVHSCRQATHTKISAVHRNNRVMSLVTVKRGSAKRGCGCAHVMTGRPVPRFLTRSRRPIRSHHRSRVAATKPAGEDVSYSVTAPED